MARVKEFRLVGDDLQSFWIFLEGSGCRISKGLKEKCESFRFFRDLDGDLQITLQYVCTFPSKVKSPSV